LPASGGRPAGAFWRDFGIAMAAVAAGLFSAAPIRESLGWQDDAMVNIAISLPVMALVHLALTRLLRTRG